MAVIEESKDISTLSIQELMGSLKSHEQRLSRHSEKSIENAFQSKLKVGTKNCVRDHQIVIETKKGLLEKVKGRGRFSRGRGRNNLTRNSGENIQQISCNICKKNGHLEKDCYFKGKPQCLHCKRFGHIQKNCRLKGNSQSNFVLSIRMMFGFWIVVVVII